MNEGRAPVFRAKAWYMVLGLILGQVNPGYAATTAQGSWWGPQSLAYWNERPSPEDTRFIRFMQAVFENDIQTVEKAIDSGMAVDWGTETGLTPVSLAVAAGYEKLALLLLKRGGRMDRSVLMRMAIHHQSLPLIKYVEAQDTGFPVQASELSLALRMGSSKQVVDYLIRKVAKRESTRDFREPFYAVAHSWAYSTPREKSALAHQLLDAGILPKREDWGEGSAFRKPLTTLFRNAKDSTLPKRFPYWDGFYLSVEQEDLDKQLGYAQRLKEVDSLLALGADPLGRAPECGPGGKGEVTGPLRYKIRKSCHTNPSFPARDWQIAGRFVEHAPQKVGPLLEKRDFLFIGATTGRLDLVKATVQSAGGESFVLQARTPDSNTALSYAAEARDSAMTSYLLKFRFKAKDKEWALQKAVLSGSPSVVKLLLEHGADVNLPSFGGGGLGKLFAIMFGYRYDFPNQNDTLIAKTLLATYRPAGTPFVAIPSLAPPAMAPPSLQPGTHPISLARCALQRKYNPTLLAFLLRRIPGPLNADTLFKGIYQSWDVLADTAVMIRVSPAGHEEGIRGAIGNSYYRCPLGKVKDAPKRVLALLGQMNGFIDKGVDLGKGLDADWYENLGRYQIGFDGKLRRFVLVWRIPSMHSAKADFNHAPSLEERDYRWFGDEQ
jgi:hypothetical protein